MHTASFSIENFTLEDYWRIVLKRKWLILGIILCALGTSWALCKVLPKSYKSTALILVESQKIPENYVQGVVTGTAHDHLNSIQQMLLSRTLLGRVAEMFKPYGENQDGGSEATIARMRNNITITMPGDVMSKDQSLLVSFAHENPVMAMKVTSTLISLLIQENASARGQVVETANELLTSELDRAKGELEAREKAVSEFKRQYMGELPQQIEANLRALDRLQIEMLTHNETLSNLNARLAMTEKVIKEYETTGTPSAELPSSPRRGDRRLPRLRELERNLATLSAIYKQNYPDIVDLKAEIARLKARPPADDDELMDVIPAQEGKAGGTKPGDPYLRELMRQRNELKLEITSYKDRQSRLAAQIKGYEGRVERTPAREQMLAVLVRDYENMQKNYQSLLDKKLAARIAENLEKRQKGEQFRIIDPANLPERPEKPNKLLIMLAGLVIGCALGFGAAIGLELLNRGFRQPEEAETLLGLPLLAAIPSLGIAFAQSTMPLPLPTSMPALLPNGVRRRLMLPQGEPHRGNGKLTNSRSFAPGLSPELNLVAKWRPMSVVAEQFRVAATQLILMGGERRSTVVVVTSAVMGEGKSTTAINLGYVLTRDLEKRTLLIDCDLKRPMLHVYAGVALEPGLAEILHGDKPLDDCLQQMDDLPLWILPAGCAAHRSVELSKMSKLSNILTTLRTRFDYIVLDAPPILPLADMNMLATMADVLALVIRAEATSRDVVKRSLCNLRVPNQAGIVLTGLQAEWTPYYMQQEYYCRSDVEKLV